MDMQRIQCIPSGPPRPVAVHNSGWLPTRLIWTLLLLASVQIVAASPVAACTGKDCVFFFRGTLTQNPTVSPDGTWVKEVELADVDADGRLDLLLMQKQPLVETTPGVFVIRTQDQRDVLYMGAGPSGLNFELDSLSTAFSLKSNAFIDPFQTNRGYDAEFADFDGDGHLDILRPDSPGLLALLLGNGDGTFVHHDAFSLMVGGDPNDFCEVQFVEDDGDLTTFCPNDTNCGGNYDDVDLADINHDDHVDFLMSQWDSCGVNVLVKNNGPPSPGDPPSFTALSFPQFVADDTHTVALGDANGDCKVDVLLGHDNRPDIFFGQSGTAFSFPASPSFTFSDLNSANAMTVADIVGDPGLSSVNQGNCDFDGDGILDDDGIPDDLPDLTGDGLSDAFFAQVGFGGAPEYGIYINNGQSTPFDDLVPCTGPCSDDNRYDVRYGDFDDDGQMEAVVVSFNVVERQSTGATCATGSSMTVFRFSGAGFTDVTDEFAELAVMNASNQGGIAVTTGDLDGDGDNDIVLGGVEVKGTLRPDLLDCPISDDVDAFGAAHVFENLTDTRLADRSLSSGTHDLVALKELTAVNATVIGAAQVTLEAGDRVVLGPGFRATPTGSGQLVARIQP